MAVTDLTYVPVIGTWVDQSLQPCSGYVVLSPQVATRFSDFASNIAVMPQRMVIDFDGTGSISTQVIATDCPALAGIAGFMWSAAIVLNDSTGAQLSPYSCVFVAPGAGPTIDLSSPQYAVLGNSVSLPAM